MKTTPAAKTKFKRDNYQRARLFHPDSFKHNGKANLNLISALLQYVPAGGLVIDVMGGTGSLLIATDHQYPVVCGELESHWAALSETNRKSIGGRRLFAASTPALCCQWDAGRLPLASESVPAIITSPPYWDMISDWHNTSPGLQGFVYRAYGTHPANLGNIHIYEDYLRAMAKVYSEAHRVLTNGGILALILKDRVHKKRRIPIVRDTLALVTALGFRLIQQIDRECIPSFHRNIMAAHHPDAPTVDTEAALIFKKEIRPGPGLKNSFALLQAPKADSAPSSQLYAKALAYAQRSSKTVLVLARDGLTLDTCSPAEPAFSSFRRRKELAFKAASDLVMKHGFGSGAVIELHTAMAYGQYLRQRLETFGARVVIPTEGLNLGQKLKWYTERE